MTVFELLHTYYIFKDDAYYSLRALGFYRTRTDVDEAIAFYRTVVGYCDSPNAFTVRRRTVYGEVQNDIVYEAMVYAHTDYYDDYEYTAELGLYASEVDAQSAVLQFRNENAIFYQSESVGIEIEEIVNKWRINERACQEGFYVEPIEQA